MEKKIYSNHVSEKALVSKIHKEFLQLNKKCILGMDEERRDISPKIHKCPMII